jgi:hypothetical protein
MPSVLFDEDGFSLLVGSVPFLFVGILLKSCPKSDDGSLESGG